NSAYVNVRRDQQRLFDGRLAGADLRNPDFVRLAESFGVEAHRTGSPQSLRLLLERALGRDEPTLIEVVLGNEAEASPWEFIMMPKPLARPAGEASCGGDR
ncbi:MAG: thiamine pyrophosphate-dependent enzyme, partial [Gammaproteobacteria bacterium]|nr:thiamine pyrophosphate-dependent enzyme [Gammaproteobacteria bacterium]